MSKRVSPSFENHLLIFLAICFSIGVYLFRSMGDETIGGASYGLFFLFMATFPIICILVCLIAGLVLWIVYHAFTKSSAPLLFLISTFFVAVVLPLPPGSAERTFYDHQSDLVNVVELARQHQLEHADCMNAFLIPNEYRDWTDKCIAVNYEPVLTVEFLLKNSYHTLVYIDTPEGLKATNWCNEDGYVFKKFDEHWYICSPYSG